MFWRWLLYTKVCGQITLVFTFFLAFGQYTMLSHSLVTTALPVLRVRVEKTEDVGGRYEHVG
jgi:hypothetical protein